MSSVRTIAVVLLIVGGACGGEPAPVPEQGPSQAVVVAAAEPRRAVEPVEVADGPIGVAECDRYVESYRRCVAGMPEPERAPHTAVVEGQRRAWTTARGEERLAAGLAQACEAASAAARVALPQCRGW
jgi:hypothetical protein